MRSELLRLAMISGLTISSVACSGAPIEPRLFKTEEKPKVPGLVITNINKDPNGDPHKVRLRGSSEIQAAKTLCGMVQGSVLQTNEVEMITEKPNCREILISQIPPLPTYTPPPRPSVSPMPRYLP